MLTSFYLILVILFWTCTVCALHMTSVLTNLSQDCTEYALGHRIKKLRKIANESGMSVPNTPQKATSGSAANTPKAPKSAKKAAPETPTQTPGKKRKSMIKTQDELVKEEEGEKKPKLEDAEEEGAYYF